MRLGLNERFDTVVPASVVATQAEQGTLVHARLTTDTETLCEREKGERLSLPPLVLSLDHPDTTPGMRAMVSCQTCIEWMRA